MCKTQGHGHMNRGAVCDCGCKCAAGFNRRFFTEAEKLRKLEDYKCDLEAELAAVAQKIEQVKKPQ